MSETMAKAMHNLYDDGSRKTLDELRAAHLARCTFEAIGVRLTIRDDVPEAERATAEAHQREVARRIAEYLVAFLPPGPCVMCGAVLGGSERNPIAAFLGTFRWGLAHGEGMCGRCGYPARGIHRIDLGEGETATLTTILQYHPDECVQREPAATPRRRRP